MGLTVNNSLLSEGYGSSDASDSEITVHASSQEEEAGPKSAPSQSRGVGGTYIGTVTLVSCGPYNVDPINIRIVV